METNHHCLKAWLRSATDAGDGITASPPSTPHNSIILVNTELHFTSYIRVRKLSAKVIRVALSLIKAALISKGIWSK